MVFLWLTNLLDPPHLHRSTLLFLPSYKGVLPSSVALSKSASASKSITATEGWLLSAAMKSGVRPSSVALSLSAPPRWAEGRWGTLRKGNSHYVCMDAYIYICVCVCVYLYVSM